MDYMHARYYSPTLARFVSVDPVGGRVGSSQSWNRYSYVLNNPLRFVDPNGEFELEAAAGSQFGQAALDHYAAILADPNSGAVSKTGAAIGGFLAATWTPETSNRTGIVLISGGTAGLGLSLGGKATIASMKVGAAIGGMTATTNSLASGKGLGSSLIDGATGTLLGAATGPIPTNPLTGAAAGAGGNLVSQIAGGNEIEPTSIAWSSLMGFGGGTAAMAADAEGAAAMLLAGGTAEVGELAKVVAERIAVSRDDDSTGGGQ